MKTLILILISFSAIAQKIDTTTTEKESTTVLKVDSTERAKIEQWTLQNTFPDIIVFIKDSLGNYIVGKEVLSDPAYEKLGLFDGQKTESLKNYLIQKSDTVEYTPKTSVDSEPKEGDTGGTKTTTTNPK